MTTYEHVHPDFRHVLLLSDEQRMQFMDQSRWLSYPGAQYVLDQLQALMHKPKKPRMPNLLLVGDPNNGKTTIIQRFKETVGQAYSDENNDTVVPLIVAEAPPSADEKGLYVSILNQFVTPYRDSDTRSKLRYQVVNLFRISKVRMLIIDEFHSLLLGTAFKKREVMNALKYLCNELAIPIVGVGTREAVQVLLTDPQHASRFDVITLPTWELTKEFQRILAGFEKVLPLKKSSRLHEPDLATLLHAICRGNLGDLHRLLVECAKVAIKSGQECIDLSIVEKMKWVRPTQGIRHVAV